MSDGLGPLVGTTTQYWCDWSVTLVDSLDTLHLMRLDDGFQRAVNASLTIDFTKCRDGGEVNLFESTIRLLGGLLAAYELTNDVRLVSKLVELGDVLNSAFRTDNAIPATHYTLKYQPIRPKASSPVPLAEIATLTLEFARLSQITGDREYMRSTESLSRVLARTQHDSGIPGLWPEEVDPSSVDGNMSNFAGHGLRWSLGAGSDSAYEYLLKAHLMLGRRTDIYSQMWHAASRKIKEHLLFRPSIPRTNGTDILFSGTAIKVPDRDYVSLEPQVQHLACFAGGMFALSSRVFGDLNDIRIAEQLTNGCIWAYLNTPTGIMPEAFSVMRCPTNDSRKCEDSFWELEKHRQPFCLNGVCADVNPPGYLDVSDSSYRLRPEAIESIFIMWRVTGNEYWREIGWTIFQSIIKHTRAPFGHASLVSTVRLVDRYHCVNDTMIHTKGPVQLNEMQSFWFAETLKYFYLLFSEPDLISLGDYVLNTEAHACRLSPGVRGFG